VIAQGSTIKSLFLDGPAGRLEALLNAGAENATHAAVVCHPHPLFGGTLHNKVVFHTMKALNSFGFPVLRFNFRGAGLSQGEHDQGNGEVEDVRTALDWLANFDSHRGEIEAIHIRQGRKKGLRLRLIHPQPDLFNQVS